MFKHGFPPEWSTFKKLIWLVGTGIAGAASGIWKTVTGTLIHITDALASPMQKCEVTLEPVQAGSGDPSPDNVRPITGWTGCEVKRTGKNTFDGVFQQGTFSNNGSEVASSTRIRTGFIPVVSGQTYAISNFSGGSTTLHEGFVYDKDKNYIAKILGSAMQTFTYTTPTNVAFIRISIRYSDNSAILPNVGKLQVELGTSATDYEPYSGTTASVTFPDTVYGGSHEFVSGGLTNKWKKVFLYGSENGWQINHNPNIPERSYAYNKNASLKDLLTAKQVISSYVKSDTFSGSDTKIGIYVDAGYLWVRCSVMQHMTTTEEWRAYLSQNPLEIVYELAEPTEIQLTPQEISTLKGVNNVWSNTNSDTTIIYKAQSS